MPPDEGKLNLKETKKVGIGYVTTNVVTDKKNYCVTISNLAKEPGNYVQNSNNQFCIENEHAH